MARKTPDSLEKTISRRMMLLAGVQLTAGFGLLSRLYYLQFVKSDEYQTLAEDNRIKIQLMSPPRGDIVDRNGVALAENEVNYRLFIERENRAQAKQSFATLKSVLQFSQQHTKNMESALNDQMNRKPLMVREHLSWDNVVKVEYHLPDLPGVYIEEGAVRYYPYNDLCAHLVGYVGRVSESEMQKDNPLFRVPEFKVGKNGVELLFDEKLRGTAGTKQIEVNVMGISVRELKHQPSIQGETLKLTIDADVQEFAANRMGKESGAVVVMDAHYGELLALVSVPAFDPNRFSVGITTDYWKELSAEEKNPLMNKAITGLYPPGSTFKMLMGLVGLKAGVVNPKTQFYCPGHYYLGNHRFNCWKPEGHGTMNLESAIAESCDTYFYEVAERLQIDDISAMGFDLGLGQKSNLGLLGEKAGLMPSAEWKKATHNDGWRTGDTINVGIGQGYVLTSPLQLAVMTSRMVNGGYKVEPSLLPHEKLPDWPRMEVDPKYLESVVSGMNKVVNDPRGTAYWRRIMQEGMEMGGKTGTSQVRRITQRGQDQSTLPWRFRHHALFVGYAPVAAPRFVVSVLVEHGGGGGLAAAPVARDVLWKVQQLAAENPTRFRI